MLAKPYYPTCCTSAFCARTECDGCPNKPALDDFKAWVDANQHEPTGLNGDETMAKVERLLAEFAEERKARQPIRVKIAMRHNGRLRWGSAGEFQTAATRDRSRRISREEQLAWALQLAKGMRCVFDDEGPAGVVVGIFEGRRLMERFE